MGCLCCGAEIVQTPKKRKKLFCDSTCRSNYWQKAERLGKQGKSAEEIVDEMTAVAKSTPEGKKIMEEIKKNPPVFKVRDIAPVKVVGFQSYEELKKTLGDEVIKPMKLKNMAPCIKEEKTATGERVLIIRERPKPPEGLSGNLLRLWKDKNW